MTMQYLRRSLCLVFACLFVLFSSTHIVYASTYNLEDEDYTNGNIRFNYHWLVNSNVHVVYSGDFTQGMSTPTKTFTQSLSGWNANTSLTDKFYINLNDNSKLFSKGSSIELFLKGVQNRNLVNNTNSYIRSGSDVTVSIEILDVNGVVTKITPDFVNFHSNTLNFTYNIELSIDELPCDVFDFYILVEYKGSDYTNISEYFGTSTNMEHYSGLLNGSIEFTETKTDKTDGLLNNIIKLVTNIKDGITSVKDGITSLPSKIASSIKGFFDNIVNTLDNVKTAITTALQTLGNMLLDGIKNLFIPTEQDFTEMKDRWENLLAERFGAIYECVSLVFVFVDTFQENEKGTIDIPTITIPLGEADFEFGGYTVNVVPDGFDTIINALKMVISISCTFLFVNTLKRKYDKLVEG